MHAIYFRWKVGLDHARDFEQAWLELTEHEKNMTNQKPSFRSACLEFARTLLIVAVSAFIAGYVIGSLGAPKEVGVAIAAAAAMASVWWQKERKARMLRRSS